MSAGEPLVQTAAPSRSVGKKVVLSFLMGLGCAAIWSYGGYMQQGAAVDMAAMPVQRAMMRGAVTMPEEMTMTKRQFLKNGLAAAAAMFPMTALAGDVDIQIVVDREGWHKLPASLTEEQKQKVLSTCGVQTEEDLKTNPVCTTMKAPIGYVHMGYWRYALMAYEPSVQDFDYFMWFDANAYLSGPLPTDPFQLMKANDLVGFYNIEAYQIGDTAAGIQEAVNSVFTKEERTNRSLSSTNRLWFDADGNWGGNAAKKPSVWGCFLGGRIDFFRQERYRKFAEAVAFNTYLSRTDEQGVIGAGWALLAEHEKVWYLPQRGIHLGILHSGWLDNSEMRVPQAPQNWTSLEQVKLHTLHDWDGFVEHKEDLANPVVYLQMKDAEGGYQCVDPQKGW